MDQKYTSDAVFQYYEDLDENLAWLIQKSEGKKIIRKTLLFPQTE